MTTKSARYSYKKFGFDKTLTYKKRKNIPPLESVPQKVWCLKLKDSESMIEVAPIHNLLVFTSETSMRHYFNSPAFEKDRHNYRIEEALITTEKYIKNRVQKALLKYEK